MNINRDSSLKLTHIYSKIASDICTPELDPFVQFPSSTSSTFHRSQHSTSLYYYLRFFLIPSLVTVENAVSTLLLNKSISATIRRERRRKNDVTTNQQRNDKTLIVFQSNKLCVLEPYIRRYKMLEFQNYRNQMGFIGTSYVPTKVNNGHQVNTPVSSCTRPVSKASSHCELGKILDMALINRKNMVMSKQSIK